jgi:hypothetical protein
MARRAEQLKRSLPAGAQSMPDYTPSGCKRRAREAIPNTPSGSQSEGEDAPDDVPDEELAVKRGQMSSARFPSRAADGSAPYYARSSPSSARCAPSSMAAPHNTPLRTAVENC